MGNISSQDNMKQPKKLSNTQIILIVGFLLVLIIIGIVGFFIYNSLNKNSITSEATAITYSNAFMANDENLVEMQAKAQEEVTEGMFLTTMNVDWNFSTGKEASMDAYVANDPNNTKSAFIEVTLDSDSELVYKSTVIPVGSALKTITLSKELKKGDYPATCTYHLLNDAEEVTSSLSVAVNIHVLN